MRLRKFGWVEWLRVSGLRVQCLGSLNPKPVFEAEFRFLGPGVWGSICRAGTGTLKWALVEELSLCCPKRVCGE